MLDKIEKLSKVLNESYSEKSLLSSLGTFFESNFKTKGFSINIEMKSSEIQNNTTKYPLFKHKKIIAELVFSEISEELNKFLDIVSPFISVKIQNIILSEKMQKNINFHETMKNIAKIIETQYELNYIIPLIGEMIDKFFESHLIYIFLKNEITGANILSWPTACNDKNILEIVAKFEDITYTDTVVTLNSALNAESERALDKMADELIK